MKEFNVDKFILNSNLIDQQTDLGGNLIPGLAPDDPMYVRQLEAFQHVEILADEKVNMSPNVIKDIHRLLTRGIDFFEEYAMSGAFRKINVQIGRAGQPGHVAFANHYTVPHLIDHFSKMWNEKVEKLGDNPNEKDVWDSAYWLHDYFECIHPFIDGNGRTGRLLLCLFCLRFKTQPMIVEYSERHKYYEKINEWRMNEYQNMFQQAMPPFE